MEELRLLVASASYVVVVVLLLPVVLAIANAIVNRHNGKH